MNIIFFGSTSDSVIVLQKLHEFTAIQQYNNVTISCVVTQPPTPVGRKQVVTPTLVEIWAKEHKISVLSFPNDKDKPWQYQNEKKVINSLSSFKPDILISACYGQKIPSHSIKEVPLGGLNIHPSLLPRWRGADPVPWTILSGDRQTGVTIVTLSDKFDQGRIIAQKKIPVTERDVSDQLRKKLFSLGANLLVQLLPDYISGKNSGRPQQTNNEPYARRLTRADGFEPWDKVRKALTDTGEANRIDRKFRALTPWPGVWTLINPINLQIRQMEKRLKILEAHTENEKLILDTVQLEGKKPVTWEQFEKSYIVK